MWKDISHEKAFESHFNTLVAKWEDRHRIFRDFIKQVVDWFQGKDEPHEHKEIFAKMLACLVRIMEDSADEKGVCHDYLWDFYMEHISHWENGQYFTPQNVSDMMAMITETDEEWSTLNKCKVVDCASWSGRMLLWVAKRVGKRNMVATCCDIDVRCCHMAFINMVLNGIDCEVYHMNTLTLEFYTWRSFKMRGSVVPVIRKITSLAPWIVEEIHEAVTPQVAEQIQTQIKNAPPGTLFS